MNVFFDATILNVLRDVGVIAVFYLTIEHGLKAARRNACRMQRAPQKNSQIASSRLRR